MTKVLVVEDESGIARALQLNFKAHGYQPLLAPNAAVARRLAADEQPEVVILDLGLPDEDGVDFIRWLRQWSLVPVIVLSARHGSQDKVAALDAGADDYVTKPFGIEELMARLRAATRRSAVVQEIPQVQGADFTVDLAARKVTRDGAEVRLTPTEWSILEILVRNQGRLVSQQQLLLQVWGPAYAKETQYLRVYLNQLRRKLEKDPATPRHLITEAGMGYRFEP
ncbi:MULTISPECIES: response regulator [Arthrobacter]|jgi:two-component system, OmpR family, KDP operon response regulator KdpE|uniref:Transcriptional regulatory protein KdpE n=1 Tax=Arthrobacter woluwensis TaxID=156980 RepID=A0A1H4LW54_9MICC|nr:MULTISPECIES: response regulator [Arthrobacter]SEB74462.1 two-component system, OmpR family, KDP operon response regulator KdpE [Arthrobacter woluwensis]